MVLKYLRKSDEFLEKKKRNFNQMFNIQIKTMLEYLE